MPGSRYALPSAPGVRQTPVGCCSRRRSKQADRERGSGRCSARAAHGRPVTKASTLMDGSAVSDVVIFLKTRARKQHEDQAQAWGGCNS